MAKKTITKMQKDISEYTQRALRDDVVGYFGGKFKEDIELLSPYERAQVYLKLAPYVMPRLEATAFSIEAQHDAQLQEYKLHILSLAARYTKPKE